MIKTKGHLILLVLVAMAFLYSCQPKSRQFEKAKALYQQGLDLSTDNPVAATEAYNHALLVLDRCNTEALEVKRLKGQIKDQLGTQYWKNGLKEEALALHKDAIEIFRQLPGNVLLLNALQNAGRVAASLHRIDEAEQYYEEVLQLSKTQSSSKLSKDILLEICRDVYMEKDEYEKVIELVTGALENGARADLCHLTLGMAYYYIDKDKLAVEHLNLATESEKADVRMEAYQGLYMIYELQKDYPKALQCFENYNENLMQTHVEERAEEMQRIQRDCELQLQNNTMETKQRMRMVYLCVILGLLVITLLVTFFILRQKTLKAKLKDEENQLQLELALKKNKVFLTALALSEKIASNTVDFYFDDNEWNDYLELIDLVYSDFTKKLLERYPTLTKTDLQICSLTRQGFSNQVISLMMNLQNNSYARRKYRIKQDKMNGAEDDRSFEEIINDI